MEQVRRIKSSTLIGPNEVEGRVGVKVVPIREREEEQFLCIFYGVEEEMAS